MGRLTLNVLFSFAQFEREVPGERIRDKIAASKKKGLWMGGPVPLGYQVLDRKLVPVPEEAERVRTITHRYIASASANQLLAQLGAEGIRTKVQQRASGPHKGGIPFARGSLFHLLKNPIYRGMIVHKGNIYQGEHEAIVDETLWDAAQARLKEKAPPRKRPTNDAQDALLHGLVTDPHGRPMVPTYATKGSCRDAYYETRKDLARPKDPPATRYGRGQLERHVIVHLRQLLEDEHALRRLAGLEEAGQLAAMFEAASTLAVSLALDAMRQQVVTSLVGGIEILHDRIDARINGAALGIGDQPPLNWSIPLPTRKPFREAKLRMDNPARQGKSDDRLIDLLADAMAARELVLANPDLSINQLATREGRCRKQLAKLVRLSWLSPLPIEAILAGKQPANLTRQRLLHSELPLRWDEQETLLGFERRGAGISSL